MCCVWCDVWWLRMIEVILGFGRILGFSNARERGKCGMCVEWIECVVGWWWEMVMMCCGMLWDWVWRLMRWWDGMNERVGRFRRSRNKTEIGRIRLRCCFEMSGIVWRMLWWWKEMSLRIIFLRESFWWGFLKRVLRDFRWFRRSRFLSRLRDEIFWFG